MTSPFGKTGEERTGHYISIKNDQLSLTQTKESGRLKDVR